MVASMMNNIFLACMFLLYTLGHSQNLVKNPGFEEYYHLPELKYEFNSRYQDSLFICKNWHFIKGAMPQYCHVNAKDDRYKIPHHILGYHPPFEGEACIGFIPLSLNGNTTLFIGELKEPLLENKKYEISFHYRFAKLYSYYLLEKIEVFITQNIKHFKSIRKPYPFYNDIMTSDIKASIVFDTITNDGEWHKATSYYTAKGGELYISFGIFYQNEKLFKAINEYTSNNFVIGQNMHKYERFYKKYRKVLWFVKRNPEYTPRKTEEKALVSFDNQRYFINERMAYYFIDNVSVIEVKE